MTAHADARAPVLSLAHASKAFAGVHALEDVSLELYAGEAHALVGENGAGKSTLVKILAGVHQPDAGLLTVDGEAVFLTGPGDAADQGIAVIYQEPTLFPDLSVAENVFIGRQPLRTGRRIDARAMDREVEEIFKRLGVPIDPDRIARGLSIAEQQLVEIAKALTRRARVLIMDEPTAALSPVEAKRLFEVVETLRGEGAAVVFISHRLEEVFAICQRVTVLRDGKLIFTKPLEGLTPGDLIRAMVGRDVQSSTHEAHTPGDVVLEVEHLTREGVFVDISFQVRAGEVVALAGLVGAGRSEVARAVFGIDRYDAGTVAIKGRALRRGSPTAAMNAGIGFVPEDRRQHGLVMEMSTAHNIALASLGRLERLGLIWTGTERCEFRGMGQTTAGQVRPDHQSGVPPVRRQPTEGRAGQVAGARAGAARSSTSRPAGSTSAPRPRSTGLLAEKVERLFRGIAESSPVGIYQQDRDNHCVYVNDRWQEITGYTFEEAMGDGWRRIIHPDDRQRVLADTDAAEPIDLSTWIQTEFRVARSDGETRWVGHRAAPIIDDDGRLVGRVGTIDDITERRKVERDNSG